MKILGYEPAALVGVLEAAFALAISFHLFGLNPDNVGLIMAVVTAGLGLVVAWTAKDTLLAALVGFAKAAIALGIGYGLTLTDVQSASIIGFITIAAGLFLRTQTSSLDTALTHESPGARELEPVAVYVNNSAP